MTVDFWIPLVVVLCGVGFPAWWALREQRKNMQLREELVVAKIRLEHKDEEIEHLHEEIAFQKEMRKHADDFLKQVKGWIFSLPDDEDEDEEDEDEPLDPS